MKKRPSHPLLDSLEKDIEFYKDAIKETATDIIKNGISKYPVFVVHELEVSLGEMILDKDDFGRRWSVNATVLEELVEKNVIQKDKKDKFIEIYKDPKKFICIFLISEKGGNFLFIPYNKKKNSEGDYDLAERKN